jgi:hypothetical protein
MPVATKSQGVGERGRSELEIRGAAERAMPVATKSQGVGERGRSEPKIPFPITRA